MLEEVKAYQQSGLLLQILSREQSMWNPVCSEDHVAPCSSEQCISILHYGSLSFDHLQCNTLQIYFFVVWSMLIKTSLHSDWWRQTLCQTFNERAACGWWTGFLCSRQASRAGFTSGAANLLSVAGPCVNTSWSIWKMNYLPFFAIETIHHIMSQMVYHVGV